jgi:choline-sulfatase
MYRFSLLLLLLPTLAAAKQNVLLITIDTLRADHLGSYGDKTIHTPNLDALAANSLFFQNAVCPAPLTLVSHTSLMTGLYPYHHGVHDNAGTVRPNANTLAEILKSNGYHTYAFISGFPLEHRFGLNQGFDLYDDTFPRGKQHSFLDFRSERTADAVVQSVLSNHFTEPYFLWIHFYDPHAPYKHGGYDGEIEFVDQQIGKLLQKWDLTNTIVAVAGDHGESLGEHGEYTHRIFVYDSTMHVPFWIKGPGVPVQKVSKQVRLIDFVPTLLSFLKIAAPPSLDGVVLPEGAGHPAYLESSFPQLELGWAMLAAIRIDDW